MSADRIAGPVESWRGLDPLWDECDGLSYTNFLVHAPCGEVVQALLKDREMPTHVADLLAGGPSGLVEDGLEFVYQLLGHDWTQIDVSGDGAIFPDVEALSRNLSTRAFTYAWEDIASGLGYQLFEQGDLVESFSMFHDNPIYQGEQGEADLAQKRAQGWRISDDHTFEFFSRRGTALDVESPHECYSLLKRTAAGLGMFVASQPFWFDERRGRINLAEAWDLELFTEAKVLHRTGTDRPHRRGGGDAKLSLGGSPECGGPPRTA